jgi:hypothetical protein
VVAWYPLRPISRTTTKGLLDFALDLFKISANPHNLLIEFGQRFVRRNEIALTDQAHSPQFVKWNANCKWWPEMLRITIVESSSGAVRLRAEGRVTDGWVEELRKTCDLQGLGDGIRLTLDLADVAFVDAAGIELLKELRSRRVTLLNPTSLVVEQLKDAASSDGTRKRHPSPGNKS